MAEGFLSSRPALRFALLFIVGVLISRLLTPASDVALISSTILFFITIVFHSLIRRPRIAQALLQLLVVMLGISLHSVQRMEIGADRLHPKSDAEMIRVKGVIENIPVVKEYSVQFFVVIDSMTWEKRTIVDSRRVLVIAKRKPGQRKGLAQGKYVSFSGTLEPFPRPRNPGDFDYGRYLELQDVHGVISTELNLIKVSQPKEPPGKIIDISEIRRDLIAIIDRFHGRAQASFLNGIILGERRGISPDLKQSFVNTGTIHVLAVSGFNVGVVALIFYIFFGLWRFKKWQVILLTIVGLLFYMVLTESSPSVVRATIMACVILTSQLIESKVNIYQSLGVAALIILFLDPDQLFDVGFQLSFAAVISIVYFYPKFESLISRIPHKIGKIRAVDYLLKLFAVSLAAQIGTLPFTAYYFERISIVALGANLLVVPMVVVNTAIGFASIILSFASDWAAQSFSALNNAIVSVLLTVVDRAALLPFAYVETSNLGASFPILYYLGIIGIVNINKVRVRKLALFLILCAANVIVYAEVFRNQDQVCEMTFLDVGQGDAIFIKTPQGKNVLIDAGPKSLNYDSGERIIGPYLKRRGIRSLDAVLITHAHSDHIGGVGYLLETFHVDRLIESEVGGTSETYANIYDEALRKGTKMITVRAGEKIELDESMRIYVLHPSISSFHVTNINNVSVVLKVVYGSKTFLLVGDAEQEAEEVLLKRYQDFLQSDVLKIGHHGSKTSTTDAFLHAVGPREAIISVGRKNKFKHPSPSILAKLTKCNININRTDARGAIILRTDGRVMNTVDWQSTSPILH